MRHWPTAPVGLQCYHPSNHLSATASFPDIVLFQPSGLWGPHFLPGYRKRNILSFFLSRWTMWCRQRTANNMCSNSSCNPSAFRRLWNLPVSTYIPMPRLLLYIHEAKKKKKKWRIWTNVVVKLSDATSRHIMQHVTLSVILPQTKISWLLGWVVRTLRLRHEVTSLTF